MVVATSTIIFAVLAIGALTGGVLFLQELQNLLALIIGNFFYMALIGVTAIGGTIILYRFVKQERINPMQAAVALVIIVLATLAVPAAGIEIGQATTTYSADIRVDTDQFSGASRIEYANLEVENVERTGPDIFSIGQQEACIFCGDWTVKADVSCDDGFSKTVTLSGQGGDSVTKKVEGMPANGQCTVNGEMTQPQDSNIVGTNPKSRYFSTGE